MITQQPDYFKFKAQNDHIVGTCNLFNTVEAEAKDKENGIIIFSRTLNVNSILDDEYIHILPPSYK